MPATFAFHGRAASNSTTTNYVAVVGQRTMWPGATGRMDTAITDDASATIMIVENDGQHIHWMEPRDLQADSMSLLVDHPQGISSRYLAPAVVMVDGTLRRLDKNLSASVLRALLTVDGGEPLRNTGQGWQLLEDGRSRRAKSTEPQPTE